MTHDRQERAAAELIDAGSRLRPHIGGVPGSQIYGCQAGRRDIPSLARPALPDLRDEGGPGQASIRDPVKVPVPEATTWSVTGSNTVKSYVPEIWL